MYSPILFFKNKILQSRRGSSNTQSSVETLTVAQKQQKTQLHSGILQKVELSAGFTLVELLVSISIFAVITAIVLASHSRFSSNISLTNLAYDIALSIREAQSYGLNSRTDGGTFGLGYGMRFRTDVSDRYTFFVDINGNNAANSGEVLEWYFTQKGNYISKICANVIQGNPLGTVCTGGDPYNDFSLAVVYRRPNPEAILRLTLVGAVTYADSATITISSPNGNTRDIVVTSAGQISVVQP